MKPVHAAILVGTFILIGPGSIVLLQMHSDGHLPWTWQKRRLTDIRLEQGHAFSCNLNQEWMSAHEGPCPAVVLEDGAPLGPGNVLHQQICDTGKGQFSFWHSTLLFSSSDNSDPRTNQKCYEIFWPLPVPKKVKWGIQLLAIMLSFVGSSLMANGFLPVGRSWLSPIAKRWRALRDRFLGNPSFAVASAVFTGVGILQIVNFGIHFRDPEMSKTGYSILGVPFTDALGWSEYGASLACGQGIISGWSALRPGYGLFLALFYTWTGPSYLLGVALNLVLTALSSALICQIGERLSGRWVGILAAIGFATQQLTLLYPLTLGTETVGLFCSVFSIHQLLYAIETGKPRYFLVGGTFLGLSNLVRPLTLLAFPLYLVSIILFLWRSRPWRGTLARTVLFTTGLFIAIGPWLLRQWLVFGILSISANTADALYAATSPQYGSWTYAIYQEPGYPPGLKDRYDYFMNKAKANLRENPGYYFHNVCTSYLCCFRTLSASARPQLPYLGCLAILGYFFSWSARSRPTYQVGLSTLAMGSLIVAFFAACQTYEASLDLVMILLLPLVARPAAALVHVVGLLAAIFGVAMFGMSGGGDARLLFLLEWCFPLSSVAFLWCFSSRVTQLLETTAAREVPSLPADSRSPDAVANGTLPRWFVVLLAATAGFVVVSGIRLVVLNLVTTVPPPKPRFLTGEQAAEAVHALDRHAPGLLRGADFQPGQILTHLTKESASSSHNRILVLPVRLVCYPYYLPENLELPHWSRYFKSRDYDRTVCYYQIDGISTPKYECCSVPAVFPGFVPRQLYGQDVVLICRVNYDTTYRSQTEELLCEGIALIPMDEERTLRLDKAYFTTHPHHPGTNPHFATKSTPDRSAPALSFPNERN